MYYVKQQCIFISSKLRWLWLLLLLLLLLRQEVGVAQPEDLPDVDGVDDVNVGQVLGGKVHVVHHAEAGGASAKKQSRKTNVTFPKMQRFFWCKKMKIQYNSCVVLYSLKVHDFRGGDKKT